MTKAGTIIPCENGHPMGYCIRDVEAGEMGTWGSAFLWGGEPDKREGGKPIEAGSPWPRCPVCGGRADFPELGIGG